MKYTPNICFCSIHFSDLQNLPHCCCWNLMNWIKRHNSFNWMVHSNYHHDMLHAFQHRHKIDKPNTTIRHIFQWSYVHVDNHNYWHHIFYAHIAAVHMYLLTVHNLKWKKKKKTMKIKTEFIHKKYLKVNGDAIKLDAIYLAWQRAESSLAIQW